MTRQSKIFVILGSKGKVASALRDQFTNYDIPFLFIPWDSCVNNQGLVPSITSGGITSAALYSLLATCQSIIFIDCLYYSNIYKHERSLHENVYNQIQSSYPNAKVIFISTFEPSESDCSNYRRTKFLLEKDLKLNNSCILRLGFLQDDNQIFNSTFGFKICSLSMVSILLPVTYSSDVGKFFSLIFNDDFFLEHDHYKIYSASANFIISIFPRLEITVAPLRYRQYHYKLPIIWMSFLYPCFQYLAKIFPEPIKRSSKLSFSRLIQKSISILEQQNAIIRTFY